MVRFFPQERIQERLTSWFLAATARFDGDEDGVNFRELLGIVQAQNPAAVQFAVHVENTEIRGMCLLAWFVISLSPDLEGAGVLYSRFTIEIEGVKDQRLVLGVEDAAEGFAGPAAAVDVEAKELAS